MAKNNLAVGLADCPEFRKFLAMVARAGHDALKLVNKTDFPNPHLSVETRDQKCSAVCPPRRASRAVLSRNSRDAADCVRR